MKVKYKVKFKADNSYIKKLIDSYGNKSEIINNMILLDLDEALKESVLFSETECSLKSLNVFFGCNLKSYKKIKLSVEIKFKNFKDFLKLYNNDLKIALLNFKLGIDECLNKYADNCLSSRINVIEDNYKKLPNLNVNEFISISGSDLEQII